MKQVIPIALLWSAVGAGMVPGQERAEALTPLKLTLTLSRPQEGAASRATYTLYLLADSGQSTELRTGREVPVPVTSFVGEGSAGPGSRPVTSFQYRNVGMNVACRAFAREGRFRVYLQLERSSFVEAREAAGDTGHPSFQTFNTSTEFLLGNGERTELVVGSDSSVGPGWNVEAKLDLVQ